MMLHKIIIIFLITLLIITIIIHKIILKFIIILLKIIIMFLKIIIMPLKIKIIQDKIDVALDTIVRGIINFILKKFSWLNKNIISCTTLILHNFHIIPWKTYCIWFVFRIF